MATISFAKKNKNSISVPEKSNLMKALLEAQIPVASSCHGDGICSQCRLTITQGAAHLSAPNDTEKFLAEKFVLKPNQRISCQVVVLGDIEIDASYW